MSFEYLNVEIMLVLIAAQVKLYWVEKVARFLYAAINTINKELMQLELFGYE